MIAADRRRLTPVLGILAVLLVALLIALWAGAGTGAHWNDDATPPPLPPVRAATPPPSVPPLQDFAGVWEHPLFSPDRRPIAVPAGSNNDANTGDLELTGVIMLPGLHMALLREKSSGRTLRVREGQNANGATVVEVKPRSAVIEVNGSRTELPLKVGPPPPNGSAGENAQQPSSQPMVQSPQADQNAAPDNAGQAQQAAPPDNGAPVEAAPETPAQAGSSQQQTPPARAPKQASNPNQEAADAWAQALKARIEQRRKQAAQKQDAQKQNDGG